MGDKNVLDYHNLLSRCSTNFKPQEEWRGCLTYQSIYVPIYVWSVKSYQDQPGTYCHGQEEDQLCSKNRFTSPLSPMKYV